MSSITLEISIEDPISLELTIAGAIQITTVLTGPAGTDGREIEIQAGETHIQWRFVGDENWTDLISIAAITGTPGADGSNGADGINGIDGNNGTDGTDGTDGREILLQADSTYIQWRYVGESEWTNLVELASLKGEPGDPGDSNHIVLGTYQYWANNPDGDTAGDWRLFAGAASFIIEYCTVPNAVKGSGTWVTKMTIQV